LLTLGWTILFLGLIDVAINIVFAYPSDPRKRPTEMQRYFEYGRSTEGKIAAMLRPTDDATAPISLLGWLEPARLDRLPAKREPGSDLMVAVYGMSFAHDLATWIKKIDPRITIRSVMGPGATPNHSYAAYEMDRGRHEGRVAILAAMAANIPMITTMAAMTWNEDAAYPYTYPRYFVEDGRITAVWPKIRTLDEMRAAMRDPSLWDEHCEQLRQHDPFYDAFIVRKSVLDCSALFRLARRGWGQGRNAERIARIYSKAGFDPECEEVCVLRALVATFARSCRQDGVLPIVFLVHNQGYSDHLFAALRPTLEENSIPYVSSDQFIPSSDPRNFAEAGHYTPRGNEMLARETLRIINEHLGPPPRGAVTRPSRSPQP
jgi:hypothetical protein